MVLVSAGLVVARFLLSANRVTSVPAPFPFGSEARKGSGYASVPAIGSCIWVSTHIFLILDDLKHHKHHRYESVDLLCLTISDHLI